MPYYEPARLGRSFSFRAGAINASNTPNPRLRIDFEQDLLTAYGRNVRDYMPFDFIQVINTNTTSLVKVVLNDGDAEFFVPNSSSNSYDKVKIRNAYLENMSTTAFSANDILITVQTNTVNPDTVSEKIAANPLLSRLLGFRQAVV